MLTDRLSAATARDYLGQDRWHGWPAVEPTVSLVSNVLSHSKYLPGPPPQRFRTIAEPLVAGMKEFIDRLDEVESRGYATSSRSGFSPIRSCRRSLTCPTTRRTLTRIRNRQASYR